MRISMRGVLLGGVALCLCAAAAEKPPAARVGTEPLTYFGKPVADPYVWMEQGGPEFDSWVKAQDAFTRTALARLPGRDGLLAHMNDLARAQAIVTGVSKVGGRLFFLRQDGGADMPKLFMKDLPSGPDRLLFDPSKAQAALGGGAGHHVALDAFSASQDGRYVALSISTGGSEESVLHVLDAESGALLPDSIDRTRFAAVSWLPDGRSFFYNRLRASGPHEAPAERFTFNKVFIHHLGNDPDKDIPVFGANVGEVKSITPTDFVSATAIPGTRVVIGTQRNGVANEVQLYAATLPVNGDTGFDWKQVVSTGDAVTAFTATRDTLYLLSHAGAPRFKILSVPLSGANITNAKVLVAQGDGVITNLDAASDGLFVTVRTGAAYALEQVDEAGKISAVKLPRAGSILDGDLSADPRTAGAVFGVQSWVTPPVWFATGSGDTPAATDLGIAPAAAGADDYVITETLVPAKDGKTKLPLTIIEKKGTPHDKARPTLVEGYGAYGISEEPSADFTIVVRAWVDAGGVMAISHVRGGGELGEDWHQAGRKATKQNSIHDFIDSAWALTAKLGYASGSTLAGMGTSAGGITVGGAITQNPGLFRAALIRVGATDMLRNENAEGGPANVAEFGTVENPADYTALLAMDAYQHVKFGGPYPAVLLTGGAQDHRVPLWQPAKMTARLQAAGPKLKGPTLLRVDFDGGHGTIGAGQAQSNAEWADDFAFLFWQLGVPAFQPKG